MHFRCVVTLLKWLCAGRIGLGWAHDVFNIAHHMLMHFHAYVPYILYILIYWLCLVLFCMFLSLSLSLLCTLVVSWHLNVSLLHLGTLFISRHPLLLTLLAHMFSSVMIKPNRTFRRNFLDKAFYPLKPDKKRILIKPSWWFKRSASHASTSEPLPSIAAYLS